jgi:hypothetical protein
MSGLAATLAVLGVSAFLMPGDSRADGPEFAPVTAWFVPSTTKVLKDVQPRSDAIVTIEGARNEYVGFQIALATDESAVSGVTLEVSDLDGPDGAVISKVNATRYREYYVEVTQPSWCETVFSPSCEAFPEYLRRPGWYPDALIPFLDPYAEGDAEVPVGAPFDISAGDLQTVFVDLYIPEDAVPGRYFGMVTVTSDDGLIDNLPLQLDVWDFAIPRERSIATAYGFGIANLWKYHGGPEGGDEATRDRILKNYEFEVHRHRMDFTDQKPPVEFTFDDEGNLEPVDFTAYDAHIGPRIDGSYYPDGVGIRRFDLDRFRPGSGVGSLTEAQWSAGAVALAEHLRDKGWLDNIYMYSSDEPWMPEHLAGGSVKRIHEDVARLRAATDLYDGKVMVTGPWWEDLDGDIDIWCPVTAMYADSYWPAGVWWGRDEYAQHIAGGGELWFYVCNANLPALMGYDLDSDIGHEPRLVKWGAWREGATGFLYWRLTYWQDPDPWHDLANVEHFGLDFARNGDGILLYPGDANGTLGTALALPWRGMDGPAISFRMKQVRDGLEDWEMLILAEQLGGGDYARAQVETVYRKFGAPLDENFDRNNRPWSMDDAPMLAARRKIAAKVQYLLHPDQYEDPEAPAVSDEVAWSEDMPDAVVTADTGPVQDHGMPADAAANPDEHASDAAVAVDSGSADPGENATSGGCMAGPRGDSPGSASLLLLMAAAWAFVSRRRSRAAER